MPSCNFVIDSGFHLRSISLSWNRAGTAVKWRSFSGRCVPKSSADRFWMRRRNGRKYFRLPKSNALSNVCPRQAYYCNRSPRQECPDSCPLARVLRPPAVRLGPWVPLGLSGLREFGKMPCGKGQVIFDLPEMHNLAPLRPGLAVLALFSFHSAKAQPLADSINKRTLDR